MAEILKVYTNILIDKIYGKMDIEKYIEVSSSGSVVRFNKSKFLVDLKRELDRQVKDLKVDDKRVLK